MACDAIGIPRASGYRKLNSSTKIQRHGPRRPHHRRIPQKDRDNILRILHAPEWMNQTPRQVYAELLDKGLYLASVSTMYRILNERGESKERRNQRKPQSYAVPRLTAQKPNQVWTWDISKIASFEKGVFFNLYLILDLWSRYPIAWMIAERENTALAKQVISEACTTHKIEPGTLTVHNDRGAPMTSNGFISLLGEIGVQSSQSRPRVSNDNAFSESCFKTIKYQPDYPGRFETIEEARTWFADFFDWYANTHRHSGIALFTPSDVFFGRYTDLAKIRQEAIDQMYRRHPERFVAGAPRVRLPPARVSINPPTYNVLGPAETTNALQSECVGGPEVRVGQSANALQGEPASTTPAEASICF